MAEFILVVFVLILVMGGYWVFMLMPKQRDFVQRQRLARSLNAGDEVITGGGLVGIVRQIDAEKGVALIEIADGLQVRVLTAAILDVYNPDERAQQKQLDSQEATE